MSACTDNLLSTPNNHSQNPLQVICPRWSVTAKQETSYECWSATKIVLFALSQPFHLPHLTRERQLCRQTTKSIFGMSSCQHLQPFHWALSPWHVSWGKSAPKAWGRETCASRFIMEWGSIFLPQHDFNYNGTTEDLPQLMVHHYGGPVAILVHDLHSCLEDEVFVRWHHALHLAFRCCHDDVTLRMCRSRKIRKTQHSRASQQ